MKVKYKTLKKIFHARKIQEYEKIYEEKFYSEQSVKIDFSYHHSKLFFIQTLEISNLLYEISKINTQVLTLNLPSIAIEQFKIKSLIDEIIDTNAIEGIKSTRKDITGVIENPLKINKKHHSLVTNFLKLNNSFIDNTFAIKSCEDIRKLFDELVSKEIEKNDLPDGEYFRKYSVNITDGKNSKLHTGLPSEKIIDAMNQTINILHNENINELIRVIIFHYLFGYIHPFYDGNGRVDRFITGYYLGIILNSILPFRLSYTIKNNLKYYYKAFEETNHELNNGDLTYFIETFLLIIKEAMEKLFSALYIRNKQLNYYLNLLSKTNFKDRNKELLFILIQAELFTEDGISVKDLAECTGQNISTIYKKIIMFTELGIIKQQDKKYGLYLEKLAKYLEENNEEL